MRYLCRPTIYYVIDEFGWVQESRLAVLRKHFANIHFVVLTPSRFCRLWKLGLIRNRYIYFASWRIAWSLFGGGALNWGRYGCQRMMVSITSHYNIGGGLDPRKTIKQGVEPEWAFQEAVGFIQQFGVVTANSNILYDLLRSHVRGIIYAPNGVDSEFYHPSDRHMRDEDNIRIGWVGKVKGAKNIELLKEITKPLEQKGFRLCVLAHDKNAAGDDVLSPEAMRDFYHCLDYHLCTSWHEGTPNPALEAAACGVPVITTRVGNMPDLIEHGRNGYFIDPNVDSALKMCEKARLVPAEDYAEMRRCARATIEAGWTWQKQIANYKRAFDHLLGQ